MASFAMRALHARYDDGVSYEWVEDDGQVPWWYSRTGTIVKWVLFWTIAAVFFIWIVGGYMHAKHRLRKGLVPLKYHRWLVSRRAIARVDPNYAYPQPMYANYAPGPPQNGYPMYSMPPPVYDPNRPPMYEGPPDGGYKIDPTQGRAEQPPRAPEANTVPEYEAPPGPPPTVTR